MQRMTIVECVSSGRLYVNEIISRGYRPLIVNAITIDPFILNYREVIRRSIGTRPITSTSAGTSTGSWRS